MDEKLVIGICDDQKNILQQLEKIIADILQKKKCQWEIRLFDSGRKLLEEADEISAVFLDIEMPGMDGIEIGREIRRRNLSCKIIMATGRPERFKDAFRIQAVRFVTKPFDHGEIEEALLAVMGTDAGQDCVELFSQRSSYQIEQYRIQYVKAYNGYIECVVGEQIFRKDCSLNEIESMLDDRLFFRIHRQCIVNLRWVQSYSGGMVQVGGQQLEVSRRRRKEFEQKYMEYDLKYRRGFE